MKKIKILSYVGDYDVHDNNIQILKGITDWEEVDDDTYDKLAKWCMMKNRSLGGMRYAIFCDDQLDYMNCVQEYLDHIEAEEKKREEAAKKREEAKRIKMATKKKLAEKEERELLNSLKQKYE